MHLQQHGGSSICIPNQPELLILELLEGDVGQGAVGGDPDPSFNSLL